MPAVAMHFYFILELEIFCPEINRKLALAHICSLLSNSQAKPHYESDDETNGLD